jgi:hypothetical protein
VQLRAAALSFLVLICCYGSSRAQDSSAYAKLYSLPDKLFAGISSQTARLEQKLERQTQRYLQRLARQERRMRDKLWKKDSVAAKALFDDAAAKYAALQHDAITFPKTYNGHIDSLQTAFSFLQKQKDGGVSSKDALSKYAAVAANLQQLQGKFDQTEKIKQFLKERQQHLKQQLQQFGLVKEFRKFQQDIYYYRSQVDEYKRLLDDPSRLEAKLLDLVTRIPAFRDFFNKHSALAGMFRLPANDPAMPIAGLQTRASVQQLLESRFGSGPDVSRAMQQNMQSAQQQLQQLKDKVMNLGQNGADLDLPGFKPNTAKTKSFWQRIELGANMQSTRGNSYFPVTSDLALSAGYRLNNRSVVGLGASYKLGWGQGIRQIKLTNEGAGLRSFIDWQMKGSIYLSGGFEYNYQQPFDDVRQLYSADNWHRSGLIGVSKIVAVQSKFLKKTKLQLLWDFLSYEQVPRSQPLKFRVGYSFN